MKKSFTILEIIFVISILTIIIFTLKPKIYINKLEHAANRIVLYLKQTRYQAMIDDQYDSKDSLWHKKRWTLKFFRCSNKVGGLYYVIYSDKNKKGHPSLNESLIDPLTKQRVYSSNSCNYDSKRSKYVLLTKEFGIKDVKIDCNSTSSLGQISFGNDGKIYTKLSPLSNEFDEYELKDRCKITFIDELTNSIDVIIEPKTGYVYRK